MNRLHSPLLSGAIVAGNQDSLDAALAQGLLEGMRPLEAASGQRKPGTGNL